jgi:hypothetical protein
VRQLGLRGQPQMFQVLVDGQGFSKSDSASAERPLRMRKLPNPAKQSAGQN